MNNKIEPNKGSDTVSEVVERGKQLIEQGNMRRLVVKTNDGRTIADVPLTIVAVAAFVTIVTWQIWLPILLVVFGIIARVKVEVVREVNEKDDVIQMPRDE